MSGTERRVNAATAPGPLSPTEEIGFSSRGGTRLHGEYFAFQGDRIAPSPDDRVAHPETRSSREGSNNPTRSAPRAAALIVHGYFEHAGRYREVAHVLVRAGLAAMSFDLRGHGRSEGQRGYVDTFDDYLDDLDAALGELDRRIEAACPGQSIPRLLLGHSNGALIVLRALADPSRSMPPIGAAVLSSPFLGLRVKAPAIQDILGRAAGRLLPRLSLPNPLAVEELTHDPEKQEERRLDTLCHESANARWYASALDTHDYVLENAARITVPTLWLVADGDRVADPAVSRATRARIRAPSRYVPLPGMHHEVFNELERERVFRVLTTYIEDAFP